MAQATEDHVRRWQLEYGAESVLHVAGPGEALEPADLVVAHDSLAAVPDWRAYLRQLAALATKVLVVVVPNPQSVGTAAARILGRGVEVSLGRTASLAPVLWELGRVREHTYFDVPAGLGRMPRAVVVRAARLHAFVVDVRPRTPQARRRLLRQA
jgi:hypothetical protein